MKPPSRGIANPKWRFPNRHPRGDHSAVCRGRERPEFGEARAAQQFGHLAFGIAFALGDRHQQHRISRDRQRALASCRYPTWGLGSVDGVNLGAGHQIFGLSLVDDWCYADLGEEAGRSPKVVRALAEKEGWTFSAGGCKVTLDWATGEARVVHEDAATPSTGGEGTGVSRLAP